MSVLTYDLWERLVQDLIYLAHNVCFRDDWLTFISSTTRIVEPILLSVRDDSSAREPRGHVI